MQDWCVQSGRRWIEKTRFQMQSICGSKHGSNRPPWSAKRAKLPIAICAVADSGGEAMRYDFCRDDDTDREHNIIVCED